MEFIMGIIVGLGVVISIYSIKKNNKTIGILNLVLSPITPTFTYIFIQNKSKFVFGGSNWEFLVQTATIDKMIEPWLILILYIILMGLTIYNIFKLGKNKKSKITI